MGNFSLIILGIGHCLTWILFYLLFFTIKDTYYYYFKRHLSVQYIDLDHWSLLELFLEPRVLRLFNF